MSTTDLIPHSTILQMAQTWKTATDNIAKAFAMLEESRDTLSTVFGERVHFDSNALGNLSLDTVIERMKGDAWEAIVKKSEVRRFMSVKRAREIDNTLRGGKLPDLTEEEIVKMVRSIYENIAGFAEEMVYEVFLMLTRRIKEYKTNDKFTSGLGKRVVLEYVVEKRFGGRWSLYYGSRSDEIRALDNVFHALDGKGYSASYHGELGDAIESEETGKNGGRGETQYFRFRCFQNKNLHVEFKRMDLVEKLNTIVRDHSLKAAKEAA